MVSTEFAQIFQNLTVFSFGFLLLLRIALGVLLVRYGVRHRKEQKKKVWSYLALLSGIYLLIVSVIYFVRAVMEWVIPYL